MSKFNKGEKKGMPELNTSSLPDLVFTILFFFMTITHMREDNPKVKVSTPQASEITKLENKSLVTTVLIGKPKNITDADGDESKIQLNDAFIDIPEVINAMVQQRSRLDEADQSKMVVSMKIDKDTKMGKVTEFKTELRKAQCLKISYSAKRAQRN